jgi:hypothetical protein
LRGWNQCVILMQPKWTAVISTGRFGQISLYTIYEGSNFSVPYMFLANYIDQSGKFSSFHEFWLLKPPKIRSLGLGIEFWDFFWDFGGSHHVPSVVPNDAPNVFPKFPCVPQNIANSNTLYPMTFAQNFTLVTYRARLKRKLT